MSSPKVLLVDYGLGNLRSVEMALRHVGAEVNFASEPWTSHHWFTHLILPGVGAFPEGARRLRETGMDESIIKSVSDGKPILGLCLGMQLLFDSSSEHQGKFPGLGLLKGRVQSLVEISDRPTDFTIKLPHIGWRGVEGSGKGSPNSITSPSSRYYFVHSYGVSADNPSTLSTATHSGIEFAAEVGEGSTRGVQFHPEKSGPDGLELLKVFLTTA